MPTYTLKVGEDNKDSRLDVFLTKNLSPCLPAGRKIPSRSFVQRLIENQEVLVNNQKVKAHYKVSVGDDVSVFFSETGDPGHVEPEDIPLDIFYEDDDLLIVNKPVGIPVHPGAGHHRGTLANALMHHCQNLSDVNGPSRPGIVHRLDQDTSGLMVVAKNNMVHVKLARQFEHRRVRKCYAALVKGIVEFDEGVIDAPIGRHPRDPQKKAVVFHDGSRDAETIYSVLHRFKNTSLVALFPQTGRTHQLRVHMNHLGHPIMGDEKYGRNNAFSRLALHAQSLGFTHPATESFIEFTCRIPAEFKAGMA